MSVKFLIVLSLCLFGVNTRSSLANESWIVCQSGNDCLVSEDQCYNPLSINKKFIKENDERNQKDRPLIQY